MFTGAEVAALSLNGFLFSLISFPCGLSCICLRFQKKNASPANAAIPKITPNAIPAFAPPLRPVSVAAAVALVVLEAALGLDVAGEFENVA